MLNLNEIVIKYGLRTSVYKILQLELAKFCSKFILVPMRMWKEEF